MTPLFDEHSNRIELLRPPVPASTIAHLLTAPAVITDTPHDDLNAALDRVRNLEVALTTNRDIGVAIGIVMTTRQVTKDTAFDLLRTASQHLNRKLRDVADQVISTGSVPQTAADWY